MIFVGKDLFMNRYTMNIGDLVRVKNINEYFDDDPAPGYLMQILSVSRNGYFTMILQGKYFGMTNWVSGKGFEIVSKSACKTCHSIV